MKTAVNNNIFSTVIIMSRCNWFNVTVEATGKEPKTFYSTRIKLSKYGFVEFCRQFATSNFSDDKIVNVTITAENTIVLLSAAGTTYTIEGQYNATLADRNTATGSLTDPASLIDLHRSGLTEAGEMLVVLDFNKAGEISLQQERKIISFMNGCLNGLSRSRQVCRTIYIRAASDKTDYYDPIVIGLYNLESEAVMTEKTCHLGESFDEAKSNTIRTMLEAVESENTIPLF